MLKFKEWWQQLGKWQVIMIVITLTTFFITLHFTGNIEKAAFVAASAAFVVVAAAAAFAAVAFVAFAAEEKKVSKITIFLSIVGQFIIIFLPMLGTILHWW